MTKVIFANRAEIDACYRRCVKRKQQAIAFKKSGVGTLFDNMLTVGKGAGYFKLSDIRNALGVEKKPEAAFTISVMPKTMANLRKAQYLPKDAHLSYLEQV